MTSMRAGWLSVFVLFVAAAPAASGVVDTAVPTALEKSSVAEASFVTTQPFDPAPCVPVAPEARADPAGRFIALSWPACEHMHAYVVFRGPSAAELVPLVEVNHANHVDVSAKPGVVYVYAIQPLHGALGPATTITA